MAAAPITILLPCKNAAATLEECLNSIQAQTFTDYSLLVLDDHSDDATAAILHRYACRDRRIRVLTNPGSGLVAALNTGLQATDSPLIARMDADDRMHPDRLQHQFSQLQRQPEVQFLGCAVSLFPDTGITAGFREYIRWQNSCLSHEQISNEIYVESPFAHPSVIFRRKTVVTIGGYRDGLFPEDYDLWLRAHRAGLRMEKLPEVLLEWRDSPQRLSRTDPRCSREAFDRLRAKFLAQDPRLLEPCRDFVIWGAGRKTRLRCRHLLLLGFTPAAWIDIDPRKIGNRIADIPVHPPEWLDRKPRPFVLIYVANHGARQLIGRDLEQLGYRKGRDYLAIG